MSIPSYFWHLTPLNKTFVSQPAVTHKTDIRGVQLNLTDAEAVRWAYGAIATSVQQKVGSEHFLGVTVQPMVHLDGGYELILGSSIDPQFGPILLFGTGGQLVEVFRDRAIALPPLNTTLARRLMEQTHERLMRLCFIDYDREMAFIADRKDPVTGTHEMRAVGRLSKMHVTQEAEFVLLVSDAFQRQGLGTELLQRLVKVGRDENLTRIVAQILPENAAMQRVCEKVGFAIAHEKEIVRAAIDL